MTHVEKLEEVVSKCFGKRLLGMGAYDNNFVLYFEEGKTVIMSIPKTIRYECSTSIENN